MPETDENLDDDIEIEKPELRDYIKQLKAENKELQNASHGSEDLKRENAFLKAGIDLENPMASYFTKGYDGELEADAIKAEASKVGLLGGDSPTLETPDVSAHETMSGLVSGDPVTAAGKPINDIQAEMWEASRRGDRKAIERIAREAGVPYAVD